MQLADLTYFKPTDFQCPCCGDLRLDPKLGIYLDNLRLKYNHRIYISSGVRCVKHNKLVGGSPGSYHVAEEHGGLACAADITVRDTDLMILYEYVMRMSDLFGGIGIYPHKNIIHVDIRTVRISRWYGMGFNIGGRVYTRTYPFTRETFLKFGIAKV
ncbi:MAG: D-Ala-D-Ala carboxypeptidase family metallohydrolase [Magnetococcus sp. WYHC-3]